MFKTKLEVDKHVDNSLKKINNENERNIRSYAFAKLYYQVGAYEQAHRYITSYLSAKPKSPEGYQLLGKCLERLGKLNGALEAYRNSLHYDSKQNHLIIKVCELLASEEVTFDKTAAKYFCELAQQIQPHNSFVNALKDRLILNASDDDGCLKDPNQVTDLLLRELETRPSDVKLRIRLIQHLVDSKQIKQAYQHASAIEKKNLHIFHTDIGWYETFANVLVHYQKEMIGQCDEQFYIMATEVLDRLVALSMDVNTGYTTNIKSIQTGDYVSNLFNFDQMLFTANDKLAKNSISNRHFLMQYQAQLHFHLATIAFKLYRKQTLSYKEAMNLCIPLLMGAYVPPPSQEEETITEEKLRQLKRLQISAAFRCSQSGHMLHQLAKRTNVLDKGHQLTTSNWRESIFRKLFPKRDQLNKMCSSYFINVAEDNEIDIKLPNKEDLHFYDQQAQLYAPNMLHNYIWVCRNYEHLEDFRVKSFEMLRLEIKNLSNCAADTLCQLDIEAFIYCATLCTLQSSKTATTDSIMPALVTDSLATIDQEKFFQAAAEMCNSTNSEECAMELRLRIVKGIEVVRCIGNHGMNVKLLLSLADLFERKSENCVKISEKEAYANRAEIYYKHGLSILEKLKANQHVIYPNQRLFEMRADDLSASEVVQLIEKAKLFIGVQLMKRSAYEKALELLDVLKDPYGSFFQSQIYRQMANDLCKNVGEAGLKDSKFKEDYTALLTKSRDYLYLTLDRLRDPNIDRNHPLNTQLAEAIESIEHELMEPDSVNDYNTENINSYFMNSSINTIQSTPTKNIFISSPMKNSSFSVGVSRSNTTWRKEARPSPERLDAQLRQLVASRDSILNNVLEQNRIMVDSHRCLLEELRSFKDAFNNLTATVDEVKSMKTDLDVLKKSVEELKITSSDTQHVIDVIHEMKREIVEFKKDSNSKHQLSEEDLYVLDTEYDYGGASVANPNLAAAGAHYLHGNGGGNVAARVPSNTLNYGLSNANLYAGLYPTMYAPYGTYPDIMPPGPLPFANPNTILQQQSPKVSMPSQYDLVNNPGSSYMSNSNKSVPINVVITSSDPLPKATTTVSSQQILSVTIPPQHLKGSPANTNSAVKPHNYQIPLPNNAILTGFPAILNDKPPIVSTQTILSNIAPPIFSAVAPSNMINTSSLGNKSNDISNVSLGVEIEKSLNKTFTETKANTSTLSSGSVDEYDPCPDFKPIIPLPDEVPTNTGEESETVLFCARAKLYRFVANEWKERGVGNIKILRNPDSGKVRILMRRDQVYKICANHYLTEDMCLSSMPNNDKAWMWAANDFADETVVLEKLCVRFKTVEDAKQFYDCFETAKSKISKTDSVKVSVTTPSTSVSTFSALTKNVNSPVGSSFSSTTSATNTLGGFVFSSTPTFKPKSTDAAKPSAILQTPEKSNTTAMVTATTNANNSPFASFSFGTPTTTFSNLLNSAGNTNTSPFTFSSSFVGAKTSDIGTSGNKTALTDSFSKKEHTHEQEEEQDDFVPTAEFKPVVEMPNLVDVKTGEENAEVLFECRAKLYRYDNSGEEKQWKERGIGTVKVLREDTTIRLVMRREQVHKVCLNHQVLKKMDFKQNTPNTVLWHAKDFSEGQLVPETFTLKFKNEELATNFLQTIQTAQTSLDEKNCITKKHHKPNISTAGLGINNSSTTTGFGDKFKVAKGSWTCKNCYIINEAKDNTCVACESSKPGSKVDLDHGLSGTKFSFGGSGTTSNWGNAFKPPEGTWECKSCYVQNSADKVKCLSCETPKEGSGSKNEIKQLSSSSFCGTTSKWGNAFKPAEGTWECKTCYVRNNAEKVICMSCETPKDGAGGNQETKQSTSTLSSSLKGIDLTVNQKFTFGIPASTNVESKLPSAGSFNMGQNIRPTSNESSTGGQKFMFGINNAVSSQSTTTTTTLGSTTFKFSMPISNVNAFSPAAAGPLNITSSQKEKSENINEQKQSATPRRISYNENEESDGSYVEEENDNIYFKPVIPLPDKVEVKTGEEQEDVLYSHRAKLFRFVDGEWKERGIGDLKILKQKTSNRLRVVMRREQVLKICLNHILTSDIEYRPKDEKTWLFHAADYSEGEICHEKFCIRFKTADIAQEFKKAIDDALDGVVNDQNANSANNSTENDKDDVIFISETIVSKEEEQEAVKLGLPAKFMAYRQLPDCVCEQCKKDDEYFKNSSSNEQKPIASFTNKPSSALKDLLGKPSIFGSFTKSDQNTSISPVTTTASSNMGSTPSTFFGFGANNSSKNIFGSTKTPIIATNIFGQSTPEALPASKTSISGETNIFKNTETNLFGTKVNAGGGSIFSNPMPLTSSNSIFGAKATIATTTENTSPKSPFISQTTTTTTTNLKESDEPILKCDSGLSFATLAAKSDSTKSFVGANKSDSENPFSFLGAGRPVFGSATAQDEKLKATDSSKSQNKEDDNSNNEHNEEDYDPHYEPIVPLPDAIVVTTGEENETVLYNERAKLYRFDDNTKEWKERGVGQMKILYHPNNNTYRFLLRREQVHKVVLNQLIKSNLELQPMSTSDKAWMWFGYNYYSAEEGEPEKSVFEKLAIRFKNCELARGFYNAVEKVIEEISKMPKSETKSSTSTESTLVPTTPSEEINQSHEVEEIDEEVDEEEDEERSILFKKRGTLYEQTDDNDEWKFVAMGDVQINYCPEFFGARILINDDNGLVVSNTIIGSNTLMDMQNTECQWRAVEYCGDEYTWRTLKVVFSSQAAADEFYNTYLEGYNYAQELNIIDEIPEEDDDQDKEEVYEEE